MNGKRTLKFVMALSLSLGALPASFASTPANGSEDARLQISIPFANHGGIRDWRVENNQTLLIEGVGGHWYRAKLMSPAIDLPFADRIGFISEPSGALDKFSTVVVRGRRYPIISLTAAEPPVKRSAAVKAATI
jgi:hypothetical protein